MKHKNPLLAWAAAYHYPQLVLSADDVVRHGLLSWRRLATSRNERRKARAWARIEQWNARMREKETACALAPSEHPT